VAGGFPAGQRTPSLVSGFRGVEVRTEQQAWKIVFAYARRRDIEGTWRFSKSELGFECPRVRNAERCRKLLMMAAVAYAFLLTLMCEDQRPLRTWLLDHYCHRRGAKARTAHLPLSRVRLALSRRLPTLTSAL
jgi:hypothetical protein